MDEVPEAQNVTQNSVLNLASMLYGTDSDLNIATRLAGIYDIDELFVRQSLRSETGVVQCPCTKVWFQVLPGPLTIETLLDIKKENEASNGEN